MWTVIEKYDTENLLNFLCIHYVLQEHIKSLYMG